VRNWPDAASVEPERIELTAVHAVVQLRVGTNDSVQLGTDELNDPNHPLHDEVTRLFPDGKGARLLAVQPMRRHVDADGKSTEHFGFVDGIGQPAIDPAKAGHIYSNQVHLGELLLGYDNQADPAPDADNAACPFAKSERMAWLRNGSFLVVRKLKQDVKVLEEAVAAVAREGLEREQILAKMMGRTLDGDPLVPNSGKNDFNYKFDAEGSACPFQAHIRRANPRSVDPKDVPEPPGRRAPRLMRRGMSYGPRYIRDADSDGRAPEINAQERGVVFMAYNASIAEQFEVVQRWLSGGNSTGVFSGQSDPFLGVAENGQPRYFRFEHEGGVERMAIDGWDALVQEPRPIVRLEWGAYLFTPSITALGKLQEVAAKCACTLEPVWSAADGLRRIIALEALERERGPKEAVIAWKSVLEDPEAQEKFVSASVWAAIREHRGGVLRTPYGVIVADRDLVMKVLQDDDGHYSVRGYRDRMVASIGEIYLGLDAAGNDGRYARQSAAPNAAIQAIKLEAAFELARTQTALELRRFMEEAQEQARSREDTRWELTLDVREVLDKVLANLCEIWFGLSEHKQRLKRGGSRWDWNWPSPPLYPGNFTAPSRYIFQPHPGESVEEFGRNYGETLRQALHAWVSDHRSAETRPTGPDGQPAPIGEAIFGPVADPTPVDLAARTFVGVLMGFLPPADGSLRLALNEWLRDGTFWTLRSALAGRAFSSVEQAKSLLLAPLKQAMQLRPSPELVWRTALCRHALDAGTAGKVWVEQGDMVVVSIVSATQQCLADGRADVTPVFGGDRSKRIHPTHACPAYEAGMGVFLGVLGALLEVKESMRPSIAPLAFVFEGPCARADALAIEQAFQADSLRERAPGNLRPLDAHHEILSQVIDGAPALLLRASAGRLLAWGDSWLHYSPLFGGNVATYLSRQRYDFPVAPMGDSGIKLETMAAEPNRAEFRLALEELLTLKQAPTAILLSGGGNDVVHPRLATLLNPTSAHIDPLITSEVDKFVDVELYGYYVAILNDIKTLCDKYKQNIPVLVHPYDYPVPDGRLIRTIPENPKSWLYPSITLERSYDLVEGTQIMRCLIGRLHAMQKTLAEKFANVIVVGVPGTSEAFSDHKKFWQNELHPLRPGWDLVGEKFLKELKKL